MICKLCGLKKATKRHIEYTHEIKYKDYLEEFEPEFYSEKKAIEKFNDLYITTRYKWIELNKEGNYITRYKEGNKGLTDQELKSHIAQYKTIGVYSPKSKSKWLIFDIDVPDKEVLKKVYNAINEHIEKEFININYSGNKGYHIELFFKELIDKNILEEFYLMILEKSGQRKNIVEGRGFTEQAVKLPQGLNFKNKDGYTNYCYWCDANGVRLKDKLYITKIKKIESNKICEIVNLKNTNTYLTDQEFIDFEEIKEQVKPLKIYDKKPVEYIEKLIKTGIKEQGTRHNNTLHILIYCKDKLGYSPEMTQKFLENWTFKTCNTKLYKTPKEEIKKEIKQMIKSVFENEYKIMNSYKKINITQSEIREILSVKKPHLKKLYYILYIHCKHYSEPGKVFYMSYEQMSEAGAIKENRSKLKEYLEELVKLKRLEIVSCNQEREKKVKGQAHLKAPNKYRLTSFLNIEMEIGEEIFFSICESNKCEDCLEKCINYLLEKKEINKLLPRRQRENLKNKECQYNKMDA